MSKKRRELIEIELPSKALRIQHATCPNSHNLMDKETLINGYPSVVVKARYEEQEGLYHLDPIYGSFKNLPGIDVPEGGVVEFFCPKCDESLTIHHNCEECGEPLFAISLPNGGRIEACSKNGCHFHNLHLIGSDELEERLDQDHTLETFL